MSRVRFPSPAPTLCDAIISPQPPVRLRLQAWSSARPEEDRMLPLRIVCPLAMLMILTSGASGQEVDDASFRNLAKQCQMRASVAASSRAIKIKDEAIAQHQAFNGSRVDRAGRIVSFGHSEAESDQEIDGNVSARQIPWRQVLGYWEKLNDRKIGEGAGGALQVWYYPGALSDDPPPVLHRKKIQLRRLLKFISGLDLSQMGPESDDLREALQQSVVRSSISDVPWSAAFVSSIMRAVPLDEGTEFSYDASHVAYITSAVEQSLRDLIGGESASFYRACDPDTTKPRIGDLFCYHRHIEGTPHQYAQKGPSLFKSLFRDIAKGEEPISRSHCDIVVSVDSDSSKVTVIGGNVQNSVTEKVLNLNTKGVLSTAQGSTVCDSYNPDRPMSGGEPNCNPNRQKWFVLLQAAI